MKEKNTSSRRDFIKRSAVSAAVFTIVPRCVLGGTGYIPSSDQLTKAVISVGAMGRNHFAYEGTRTIAMLRGITLSWRNGKTPANLLIKQCRKNSGRMKLRKTAPIYRTIFTN